MEDSKFDLRDYEGFETEFVFDSAEKKRAFVIVGKHGNHIRVSENAFRLLQAVRAGVPLDQLAQTLGTKSGGKVISTDQLESAFQLIIRDLARIDEEGASGLLRSGFWLRWCILSRGIVSRIANSLSFPYTRPFAFLMCLFMSATVIYVACTGVKLDLNNNSFMPSYLLFLVSLIIHEFGHVSACAWYGVEPSDIGFTVYLIYPAFYSDVSASWKLTRWQRVVVDLAGCYFQIVWGGAYLLAFHLTGWEPLRTATVMILYLCLFSLNPIFKFDGYWVLADALGVPNLAKQPSRFIKFMFNRIIGRPNEPLPWPNVVVAVLAAYSLIGGFVWISFVWKLFPTVRNRIEIFTHCLTVALIHIGLREWPPSSAVRGLFWSSFFFALFLPMLWKLGKQLVARIPVLRAGLLLKD